jgi:hypothetical protein
MPQKEKIVSLLQNLELKARLREYLDECRSTDVGAEKIPWCDFFQWWGISPHRTILRLGECLQISFPVILSKILAF